MELIWVDNGFYEEFYKVNMEFYGVNVEFYGVNVELITG